MSCNNCKHGKEDDVRNSYSYICKCNELLDGKPNEHYLHMMDYHHTCPQDEPKPIKPSWLKKLLKRPTEREKGLSWIKH